ncbi:MAG: hypothetical protein BWY67_02525 [Bacteroidetes bacterium ADurb.Bin397]|jgi:hypothetical protein|nr:MAG: hypothetical protein BWY67_02525 [Bacteroidetes bacterium ADurb.Bin397]
MFYAILFVVNAKLSSTNKKSPINYTGDFLLLNLIVIKA